MLVTKRRQCPGKDGFAVGSSPGNQLRRCRLGIGGSNFYYHFIDKSGGVMIQFYYNAAGEGVYGENRRCFDHAIRKCDSRIAPGGAQ
jgi:hypothetical protein